MQSSTLNAPILVIGIFFLDVYRILLLVWCSTGSLIMKSIMGLLKIECTCILGNAIEKKESFNR